MHVDIVSNSKIKLHHTYTVTEISGISGVTYTRWGKTSCPSSTGAQLLYSGRVAGNHHKHSGGGAERLCLPDDPDYRSGTKGYSGGSPIFGTQYAFKGGPNSNVGGWNAPCAVCYVPNRATAIMVPAKTSCPGSWTTEYIGYLTAEHYGDHRSSFDCVDVNSDRIPGTGAHDEAALYYYVHVSCSRSGLACPPYENYRVLSCVQCTK